MDPNEFQDQKELERAERSARESADAYDLDVLPRLRLSYENICEIDNLQGYDTLTHLSLDNNVIREINNLEHLVNLTWLDLSFNNIREIQGLEALVNLKDLSMANNKIKVIQGLDKNTSLQCLSLGNNLIQDLDSIGYLRKFSALQMLNLMGNPVSKEDEFRQFVVSHVEQLHYLDYTLITDPERVQAREVFQDELMILAEKEAIEQVTIDKARGGEGGRDAGRCESERREEHVFRPVGRGYGDWQAKASPRRGRNARGLCRAGERGGGGFHGAWHGAAQAPGRRSLAQFHAAVDKTRLQSSDQARERIETFESKKKECFSDIQSRDDPDLQPLLNLRDRLDGVMDELLEVENSRLDVLDKLGNEMEGQLSNIKAKNLELQNTFFRAVENFESIFNEQVAELVAELSEKFANEDLNEEKEEVMDLLADKEILDTAVQGSNDIHIGKLLAREDELRANEVAKFQKEVSWYKELKFESNRKRVAEIHEWKVSRGQKSMRSCERSVKLRKGREITERKPEIAVVIICLFVCLFLF